MKFVRNIVISILAAKLTEFLLVGLVGWQRDYARISSYYVLFLCFFCIRPVYLTPEMKMGDFLKKYPQYFGLFVMVVLTMLIFMLPLQAIIVWKTSG